MALYVLVSLCFRQERLAILVDYHSTLGHDETEG